MQCYMRELPYACNALLTGLLGERTVVVVEMLAGGRQPQLLPPLAVPDVVLTEPSPDGTRSFCDANKGFPQSKISEV